jgi:hypothetical protein
MTAAGCEVCRGDKKTSVESSLQFPPADITQDRRLKRGLRSLERSTRVKKIPPVVWGDTRRGKELEADSGMPLP